MAQDKGVVFRRINGRIVPIKINDQRGQNSAKLIGSGLAVGAGAGAVAAHLHREAADHENVARTLKKVAKSEAAQIASQQARHTKHTKRLAALNTVEAKRFYKAGTRVKQGGAVVSSVLIGAGVDQALDKTSLKDKPVTKSAVSTSAALASNFAIRSAYTKVLGKMKTSKAVKHAFKRVAARGIKL